MRPTPIGSISKRRSIFDSASRGVLSGCVRILESTGDAGREKRYAQDMTAPRHLKNLALIGFMGTGKSSVGRLVANHLRFKFIDTDDLIEARAGRAVGEIFKQSGEEAFREIERQVVAELGGQQKIVISTGGGLASNDANLADLSRHALIVCLWASPEIIWERVRGQTHRPLLNDPDPPGKIRQLLAAREPFYKKADVLVNTERRSIKEVAQHVLHQFHMALRRPSPP